MKDFIFYLKRGMARKVSPDRELSKSLFNDMKQRMEFVDKIGINQMPKVCFENIYDSLRDFCGILLSLDGYNTDSHEAAISYLFRYNFDDAFIAQLDKFRINRNYSKYRGFIVPIDLAERIYGFYQINKEKIYKILKEKELI